MNNNYHDLYIKLLKKHISYQFHNTPRNASQYERIFTNFTLDNPIQRVILSKERKVNIVFLFAEFLWYLSGDNTLDFISYYSKSMANYSKDKLTLQGTAYGPKINMIMDNGLSQIDNIIALLKSEPCTKRAVLSIFSPNELAVENNIDVSCTLNLQFFIRDNRLDCIAYMRANDMYVGNVSDVFSFTMIQEYIANKLGINVGKYYHCIGSSHIYDTHMEKAKKVIENYKKFSSYNLKFPRMPKKDNKSSIEKVLIYEEKLRHNNLCLSIRDIESIKLNKYWKDVIALFELKREVFQNENINQDILNYLHPTLRYLFQIRFIK